MKRVGRFEIIRVLGKGAQSVVYLGYDPHLQREVAIKTLHVAPGKDRLEQVAGLLQEARIVSKLRHPNIVPIFEAGEQDGGPYLVFEYVDGSSLAEELKTHGPMPVERAVGIMVQVLEALDHAHHNDIIHRDLKPSNILLTGEDIARVMDFGIAERISHPAGHGQELSGTPAYMAPEYISSGKVGVQADVYAAGLVLYEMIAGRRAVDGPDVHAILFKVTSGEVLSAEALAGVVDEKLSDILLKAVAHDPLERYASAGELAEALRAYQSLGEEAPSGESKQSTLEFLLRRMRHKSDFPALSESVSTINRLVASEAESAHKLSNSILKDFGLTNKILKLVNSAYYSQFGGGSISTISRAVVILGFDAVRNIAITLLLFEHLQNKAQAAQLKDEFAGALLGAMLAREIAERMLVKNAEEVFICAMFHNLGRLLAMFYLPEEVEQIRKLISQKGWGDEIASAQVLGISYQDLGIGVAKTWGFPDHIVHSMRKFPEGPVKKPANDADRLRAISSYAGELCDVIASTPREKRSGALVTVASRYKESAPLSQRNLESVLEKGLNEIQEYGGTLRLNLHQTPFGKQVAQWLGRAQVPTAEEQMATEQGLPPGTILAPRKAATGLSTAAGAAMEGAAGEVRDAQSILTAGIQDISNSLVDGVSLNDILRIIMETMYRGIGFTRVLLCIKDARQGTMNGRFGFGPDIQQLARNFKFPLSYTPDVFHAATSKNVDILISDIDDPSIRDRVPDWYRKTVTAQTFVLFPLNIKGVPVALIYADKDVAGTINIPHRELDLLRTLRNQALLALKQSL